MIVIGVTGSFGTGKTTVAGYFKGLGAIVLDADKIAHEALRPGRPTYKNIERLFGKRVLTNTGAINRKYLGTVVFKDNAQLKKLIKIIHPYVISKLKNQISKIKNKKKNTIVVLDVPLLIEANLLNLIDALVVVTTTSRTQLKRCLKTSGLSRKEILARVRSQMPLKEKIRISDFVIDNNGTSGKTKREVRRIWEEIQKRKAWIKTI